MHTPKTIACCLELVSIALFAAACTTASPRDLEVPTVTAPVALTDEATGQPAPGADDLRRHLKDRQWQKLPADAIGDGTFLPDMASFRADPKSALGAVYARTLKPSAAVASCDSMNADDYVLLPIELLNSPDDSFPECTPTEFPPKIYEESIVKGGTDAEVDALIGEAGAAGDFAYELLVSNISAVYPEGRTCIDPGRVVPIHLPQRTCELWYVRGATTTQVTYRQYTAITGTVQYNSVITVQGSAYGSSEQMQALLLLTGNFRTLTLFNRGDDGFLVSYTAPEAASVVAVVEAQAPTAVISDTALSTIDRQLLPELSLRNLRDDRARLQTFPAAGQSEP